MKGRWIAAIGIVLILIGATVVWVMVRSTAEYGFEEVDAYLDLTDAQKDFLEEHNFVVVDGSGLRKDTFLGAYEDLNEEHVPIIVTTDCMLHQYHVFFDTSLKNIEEEELYPLSLDMSLGLMYEAEEMYQAITDPWLKPLAERVVAYFTVPVRLTGIELVTPAHVEPIVSAELALIEDHAGFSVSPVFADLNASDPPHYEDYSQYVPRGHYTDSENLKLYFKMMMWYGRQAFYNYSLEETAMAVLAARTVYTSDYNEVDCKDAWERIYGVTEVFVGESDDLMPGEYVPEIREVFGGFGTDYAVVADHALLEEFRLRVGDMRSPSIRSTLLGEGEDVAQVTKGLRIMGQRWIPDSYMFTNLVHDEVDGRHFPKGLDVLAVLDCERADELLADEKKTYPDLDPQIDMLSGEFDQFTTEDWTENLYMGWMDTLTYLHPDFSASKYPDFMQDRAWRTQKVNTHLGSWTELRHDTILYAKQSYTAKEGAEPGKKPDERGYVEPIEGFYPRMIELVQDTQDRLDALGVLSPARVEEFDGLLDLLDRLDDMVDRELSGKDLTDGDIEWLRGFGNRLAAITGTVDSDDQKTLLVADVHTDTNSNRVLEEGVGYVDFLVVKVKDSDGNWRYCTGPVFSYYEFTQPMSDRLTDEAWTDMLKAGQAPERPEWTDEFLR